MGYRPFFLVPLRFPARDILLRRHRSAFKTLILHTGHLIDRIPPRETRTGDALDPFREIALFSPRPKELENLIGLTQRDSYENSFETDRRTKNHMATIAITKDRIQRFRVAWRELAADHSFGGMTLAQFEAATEPSMALRAEIESLEKQLQGKKTSRSNADRDAMELLNMVVNSVKGTPGFGPDSPLYRALGYVRKSERRSGLSRPGSSTSGSSSGGGQEEAA